MVLIIVKYEFWGANMLDNEMGQITGKDACF